MQDYAETVLKAKYKQSLKKHPIEYFRLFYADTALNGSTAGLMCGYHFFGSQKILFGTDMPYDNENGQRSTRDVIESIYDMDITSEERRMIFRSNAEQLLRLGRS